MHVRSSLRRARHLKIEDVRKACTLLGWVVEHQKGRRNVRNEKVKRDAAHAPGEVYILRRRE